MTRPILLLLALFLAPTLAARPDPPTIDANATPPVLTQEGLYCEIEADCPIRQYCYILDVEGVTAGLDGGGNESVASGMLEQGVCGCYAFYGLTGPTCEETSGIAPIFSVVTGIVAIVQFGLWMQTFYQLNSPKVKAFQFKSASGKVTVMSMGASFMEILMSFCYFMVSAGLNNSYEIAMYVRPASFALCVLFKLGGCFEVPIMWMDIVIKSPGMNTPENKALFKRIAKGLRIGSALIAFIILVLMFTGRVAMAGAFFVLVLMGAITMYNIASRKLALMICKDFWEHGYNPDMTKFKGSAEKSGHNAAKNIVVVANYFAAAAVVFIIGLLGLSATVKDQDNGIKPFISAHVFLLAAAWIEVIFRGYVRLGARKKLSAAGFGMESKVTTVSTMSTGVDSVVDTPL